MKKLIRNTKALTLTELLVATAMLGIVIVGVVTVDLSIRRMQQINRRSGSVSMEVSAAMMHMVNNASLAMGHRTDPGIVHLELANTYEVLFFRIDFNSPPTPSTYADDTWVRYMADWSGLTGEDRMLLYCDTLPDTTDVDPTSCDGTQIRLLEIETVDFDFENNLGNLDFYVEINIRALPNPALPANPISNKVYGLATRVSPLGHTY